MDIVIYTNPKTLSKKKRNRKYDWHYWKFGRMPKDFDEYDNIYFACGGEVMGCFVGEDIDDDKKTIEWYWNTWRPIKKKIPTKPFRGFRYKWW